MGENEHRGFFGVIAVCNLVAGAYTLVSGATAMGAALLAVAAVTPALYRAA